MASVVAVSRPAGSIAGTQRLAQFDTRITRHRDLIGLRTTHQGHDGFERSIANQFLDQRVANRSRCTQNQSCLRARHEMPFVDVPQSNAQRKFHGIGNKISVFDSG